MIQVKNITRIMVKVTDLDRAVEFAEKVLGAKFFYKAPYNPDSKSGLRTAMSTEPGLELMQVVNDHGDLSMFEQHPNGKKMFEFLLNHEPGIVGVVFDMDGVKEARETALSLGIGTLFKYDFTQEQIDTLGWNYSKYLEYFLEPDKTGNAVVLLSEFKSKN